MMHLSRTLALGFLALTGMTGLVLLVVAFLLSPPPGDLVALTLFLLLSGGLTIALGLGIAHLGWSGWTGSLRARLLLSSVLTALLGLANVGFTAVLMFLSPHDLALLAGLLGFALGMSIFVATILSSATTRSFHQLVDAVNRITAGDLTARLPVHSQDEVGKLASTFNHMVERLEESFTRE
jgi:methyl-accepting chemotaxis protein